jgi:hypothetical protein
MISFVKKLLKKREKIGITLDKLEDWFEKQTNSSSEDIENKISQINENLKNEINKTIENIENLKNAKLKNEQISTKEKQYMQGNRDFYIKRVSIFVNSIVIPKDNVLKCLEKIHTDINAVSKSTAKAYQILQHFFSDETYKIAQNIKSIDSHFKQLKDILQNKEISMSKEVKEEIKNLKNTIEKEIKLKKEIKVVESKIKEFEQKKKQIISKLTNKEQGEDFQNYHKLKVDEYKINEQLNEIKDELFHYFSSIEHTLKKHIKINLEDEELLNKYLKDPLSALVKDSKLEIQNILRKITENIDTDKIEIKLKKKEKTLKTIENITEKKLNSFLMAQKDFLSELKNINEKTAKYTIINEIEDIKKSIKKSEKEIQEFKDKLIKTKEDIKKIDITKQKETLKTKISELLNIELNLD